MEECDQRLVAKQPGPLISLRDTLHGVNCRLDNIRCNVQKLVPANRSLIGTAFQSMRPRRTVRTAPCNGSVSFRGSPFAAAIPGDGVVEQVFTTGISSFLNLYNTVLIGRIILTWFPQAPPAIVGPLSTVTDPYLNLFRGIIPPLGGTLDLSPILAFVALDLFTNVAATLPCELDGPLQAEEPSQLQRLKGLTPSNAALGLRRKLVARRKQRTSPQ